MADPLTYLEKEKGRRRCMGEALTDRGFMPCSRWATVVRDGFHYCWQHDPERGGTAAQTHSYNLAMRRRKLQETNPSATGEQTDG